MHSESFVRLSLPFHNTKGLNLHTVGIFGKVMHSLYAIRPAVNQQMEALALESSLDKWYLDLPDHLRCELVDTGSSFSISLPSKQRKPLPNVLGLHMYYWTTVLVLHRSL